MTPGMVTFDEAIDQAAATADDLLALDTALDDLARLNPRQAAMVESRYFGGLEVRRDGVAARRLRSDNPARLACGESVARRADSPNAGRLNSEGAWTAAPLGASAVTVSPGRRSPARRHRRRFSNSACAGDEALVW